MKEKSKQLNGIIFQSNPKTLPYPDEDNGEKDEDMAVPSGAMFEFDYSNITRIPDDMLEKMNMYIESTRSSGASGSTVDNKDIKPIKQSDCEK
jgi:hypothetical protein